MANINQLIANLKEFDEILKKAQSNGQPYDVNMDKELLSNAQLKIGLGPNYRAPAGKCPITTVYDLAESAELNRIEQKSKHKAKITL